MVGSLGWLLADGLQHRWTSEANQWANEGVRTSLAAVNEVVTAAGERPIVLVMNYTDADDATGSNTAYGWAKTYTNVFRTGIPGDMEQYSATYLGTLQDFLAGRPTSSSTGSQNYEEWSQKYFDELQVREKAFPADPVVFVVGQYYWGYLPPEQQQAAKDFVTAHGTEIGPDTYVMNEPGLWMPPTPTSSRRRRPPRRRNRRRSPIRPGRSATPSTCCACSSACSCSPSCPG